MISEVDGEHESVNPCSVTVLLFNASHFSVCLFGFIILLRPYFLSHKFLINFPPPDLWIDFFENTS